MSDARALSFMVRSIPIRQLADQSLQARFPPADAGYKKFNRPLFRHSSMHECLSRRHEDLSKVSDLITVNTNGIAQLVASLRLRSGRHREL